MKKLYSKMEKQFNKIAGILSVCFVLGTGCGEPNIQSMHPTVEKLATEIILVDQPANWSSKNLTGIASQNGMDALVISTDAANVTKITDSTAKNGQVGLYVFVCNGPIPEDLASYPAQYPETKFEFVSDGTNMVEGQNVRNLYLNKDWIAFMVGYASGLFASQTGGQSIGWVDGNTPSFLKKTQIQAMLTGAYSANPKVTFVPVTIGAPGVPLPHILVTNRVLTSSELVTVSQSGSVVLSLTSMQVNQPLSVWPAGVQENAVVQDISSYANSVWKPGNQPTGQIPCITVNPVSVSQSISETISTEESLLMSNPTLIQTTEASIPDTVKASFTPLVNTGS